MLFEGTPGEGGAPPVNRRPMLVLVAGIDGLGPPVIPIPPLGRLGVAAVTPCALSGFVPITPLGRTGLTLVDGGGVIGPAFMLLGRPTGVPVALRGRLLLIGTFGPRGGICGAVLPGFGGMNLMLCSLDETAFCAATLSDAVAPVAFYSLDCSTLLHTKGLC